MEKNAMWVALRVLCTCIGPMAWSCASFFPILKVYFQMTILKQKQMCKSSSLEKEIIVLKVVNI